MMKVQRYFLVALATLCFWGTVNVKAAAPAVAYAMKRVPYDDCEENLKAIYTAMIVYSQTHNGALPAANNLKGLLELAQCGLKSNALYCTSSKGKAAKTWKDINLKNCSYVYFGGFNLAQAIKKAPYLPLVFDCPDNHHMMVLFANGEVVNVEARSKKAKITDCKSLVMTLSQIYPYPKKLLEAMFLKAAACDTELSR